MKEQILEIIVNCKTRKTKSKGRNVFMVDAKKLQSEIMFLLVKRCPECDGELTGVVCQKCSVRSEIGSYLNGGIQMELIIKTVSDHFNLTLDELKSGIRKNNYVLARQLIMYYGDKMLMGRQSDAKIAALVNRDRATLIHARKVINNYIDTDKQITMLINHLETKILNANVN